MLCPHCKKPITDTRSSPDHRRLFCILKAAFHHWPETHEFQPTDADHLRAYLLCRAGYRQCSEVAVPYAEDQPSLTKLVAISIEAAVRGTGGYAFIRPDPAGGRVAVYSAKSLKFSELPQKGFNEVREAVEQVIRTELGVEPDQLLKETERAA